MNLQRVYITGPDCTGKSTFAKALAAAAGMIVTKFSYVKTPELQAEQWEKYREIAYGSGDIILDRGWHGPFCYTGILGNQPYDELEMLSFSKQFTAGGGTILLFHAIPAVVEQRMKERGDEYIEPSQIHDILNRYFMLQVMLEDNKIPFHLIDTSNIS